MGLDKIRPGSTVYSVGRTKMGNTTMNTVSVWMVRIIEVDVVNRCVMASWNSNTPKKFYERDYKKWREKRPVLVETFMGRKRLATREERKAACASD